MYVCILYPILQDAAFMLLFVRFFRVCLASRSENAAEFLSHSEENNSSPYLGHIKMPKDLARNVEFVAPLSLL